METKYCTYSKPKEHICSLRSYENFEYLLDFKGTHNEESVFCKVGKRISKS